MLTNQVLQKLKDEGKIRLQKIIGAVLIKIKHSSGIEKFTEIVEYIEFDNSVNSEEIYNHIDGFREVIGMIPVYDIYSVYAIKEDKLNFLGYYSNDELIVDNTDWEYLYNMNIKGEI